MASRQRKRRTDITTIQVDKSTRAKLDAVGDIHSEDYNTIILRLIQFYNKHFNGQEKEEMVEVELPVDIIRKLQKLQKNNPTAIKLLSDAQTKPVLVLTR